MRQDQAAWASWLLSRVSIVSAASYCSPIEVAPWCSHEELRGGRPRYPAGKPVIAGTGIPVYLILSLGDLGYTYRRRPGLAT